MKRVYLYFKPLMLMAVVLLLSSGCELRKAMYDQPKLRPLQASEFFEDGMASRKPVEGTVARGLLKDDTHLYDGMVNGELATTFPAPVTLEVVQRGRQRYDIFCAPCHDRAGTGNGMIVKRGFKQPPSFHEQRLRDSAPGYYYNVIKNGFGVMQGYGPQVPVEDRWAITAYVKALQLSQNAVLADVPEDKRAELETH